jgi:hypothetical protein
MNTVPVGQDRKSNEGNTRPELALPPSVQAALGEIVNAAGDGLLALSVGVGLSVVHEVMEAEVVATRRCRIGRRARPCQSAFAAA